MVAKRTTASVRHPSIEETVDDLSIEYPSSDGEPMSENQWQYVAMTDTVSALANHFIHRDDVFVAGDLLVYYRMNDNATRVAPDVFVVFGANGKHLRDSWIVWREGKAPDFVIEVASPSTWRRDAAEKRDIYAEMGVSEYWRFDPTGEHFTPQLVGERLADGEYHQILLETEGDGIIRGHSAVLGLDICVRPGLELRLYDPESGQWLRTHRESEEALQSSEAGRQAAEEEVRRLREQLRNLQGS